MWEDCEQSQTSISPRVNSPYVHPVLCQYLAMSCDPVIVIHGGAWAVPDHLAEASRRGVREAARAGHRVLASGGSAVEAVTAAVKVLEDDPAFDAGARMEA